MARGVPVQLAAQIGVGGLFGRGVVRDAQGRERTKEEGCGAFHGCIFSSSSFLSRPIRQVCALWVGLPVCGMSVAFSI